MSLRSQLCVFVVYVRMCVFVWHVCVCVCACVRASERAHACACACVCMGEWGENFTTKIQKSHPTTKKNLKI